MEGERPGNTADALAGIFCSFLQACQEIIEQKRRGSELFRCISRAEERVVTAYRNCRVYGNFLSLARARALYLSLSGGAPVSDCAVVLLCS
jgi:hypothetical protein